MKRNIRATALICIVVLFCMVISPIVAMAQQQNVPATQTQSTASQTTTTPAPSPTPATTTATPKTDLGLTDVTPKTADTSKASAKPATRKHRRHHRHVPVDPTKARRNTSNEKYLLDQGAVLKVETPSDEKQVDGKVLVRKSPRIIYAFVGETVPLNFELRDAKTKEVVEPMKYKLAAYFYSHSDVATSFDDDKDTVSAQQPGVTTLGIRAVGFKDAFAQVSIVVKERQLNSLGFQTENDVTEITAGGEGLPVELDANSLSASGIMATLFFHSSSRHMTIEVPDKDSPMGIVLKAKGVTEEEKVTLRVRDKWGFEETKEFTLKPADNSTAQAPANTGASSTATQSSQSPSSNQQQAPATSQSSATPTPSPTPVATPAPAKPVRSKGFVRVPAPTQATTTP